MSNVRRRRNTPCPTRLSQMPSFFCTSRSSFSLSSDCLQCSSGIGEVGLGQITSGGAYSISWQLVSSCFRHGWAATVVSRYSNQICARRPAKLAMSAASSSTGFSGCSTTKLHCGSLLWSTPSLVLLLLGHGGAIHQTYAKHRMATPNPSVKLSTNGGPPGPGRQYGVHFCRPGPGVPPLAPAYLER